ncbi:MAG: cyclic nucleotide-binding domain-containing protein [Mariprofundaceae bacterium]|nr:cyclic nucleotide-binding domain-containing protein [Mariprofundaceae bacterium]
MLEGNQEEAYQQAQQAIRAGEFEKARKLYAKLWKSFVWQGDRDLQINYAYACEKTGRQQEALKIYREMMDNYKHDDPSENSQVMMEESMVHLREMMLAKDGKSNISQTLDVKHNKDDAQLIRRLFRYGVEKTYKKGADLCQAGDIASEMWLLFDGALDVIVPNVPQSQLMGNKSNPCLLGELAYFTGLRRAATLIAAQDIRVYQLPYARLEKAITKTPEIQKDLDYLFRSRLAANVLGKHAIFSLLNEQLRYKIALSMTHEQLAAGEDLVQTNQEAPDAFMIQSGTALMLQTNSFTQEESLIGSMRPGDFFHLGGLLRGFKPDYKVVAGSPCRILRLRRQVFEPLMMKHPKLIKSILEQSRQEADAQIMHPEAGNLWAANRYIDMKS